MKYIFTIIIKKASVLVILFNAMLTICQLYHNKLHVDEMLCTRPINLAGF